MTPERTVTEPQRIDRFVAEAFGISRSQAAKKINSGCVRCNGERVRKASKNVKSGDLIELTNEKVIPDPCHSPSPNPIHIPILYEDSSCIIANKPAGLVVHPAQTVKNDETLIEILRKKYDDNLHLVHRLDKDTTGCILIAKTVEAHEKLQKQFKDRSMQKVYFAIVMGIPKEKKATIEAEIGRSLVNRMKMSLFRTGKSRHAVTTYEILSHTDDISLLKCTIKTGRTHQIRVHLSSIGHPILGDEKYATEESRTFSKEKHIERFLLHAGSLKFVSPETSDTINVVAPFPAKLKNAIETLGLRMP